MRFLRQSLIGLFLTAVTFGLLIVAGQMINGAVQARLSEEGRSPPARERSFAVNVATAKAITETPVVVAFGEVQSQRTLELRASATGRVLMLAPDFVDGGEVVEGQVLAEIDPADAQASLERAQADVADAQAEVRDADRSLALARDELAAADAQADLQDRALRRQRDLQARGVGTAAAVEAAELARAGATQTVLSRRQSEAQAEARVDQAQTRLTRSNIALADAQRALADTSVHAPFSGTLAEVSLVEGRLVAQNEKLADLIDPEALEVSFRISTAQYTRLLDEDGRLIPANVEVSIDVSGIDLVARGVVTRASVGTGAVQTGRLVFARLDRAIAFKPGDFVTVKVQERPVQDVVRLPATAVDANLTVLVLDEENRLESLPVTLVRRQGDDVLVRAPALEGRQVVQSRSPLFGTGILVKPLSREAGQAAAAAPAMLELSDERRAKLVAFVESNKRMPAEAKARVLARLAEPQVPAQMVARIESRMGG